MTASLDQLISDLVDETQPLPVARFPDLSDLDPPQAELLKSAWPKIPTSRRRSLLVEIGQLADLRIEYSFESINRLALDDDDPDIRRIAIENLWECEDTSLALKLLVLLKDDVEHSVRSASATALAPFVYICEVSDSDSDMMREIEEALLNASQNDPDIYVRLRAIESLGHSSRPEISSLIQRTYDVGDDEHKSAALVAMGRSASKDWLDIIMSELHNPSPELRAQAATAAGQIELRESLPDLIEHLDDVSSEVRLASIWALGQLGGSSATDALSALLESADEPDELDLINESLDHAIFIDSTRDLVKDDVDENEGTII
jgi:HEAT repeat protein